MGEPVSDQGPGDEHGGIARCLWAAATVLLLLVFALVPLWCFADFRLP